MTKEDLVDLAIECTGMTRSGWNGLMETLKSDAAMNQIMKAEWLGKGRDSEEAIREYYRSSDIWFVNTFNHGVGALLQIADMKEGKAYKDIYDQWQNFILRDWTGGPAQILDYGGGFFKDTWQFILAGHHVTQAEVRGPVTMFLQKFLEELDLEWAASVLEVDDELPLSKIPEAPEIPGFGMFDAITCFETLEHVLKPIELTEHLVEHLLRGGRMAMSVSFGAPEHAPYHIASNAILGDQAVWFAILGNMCLQKEWISEDRNRQIWRKA